MATIEHRRNREGRIVAVRVKLRLAGRPHLSKTFQVADDTKTALQHAVQAAERWAASITDVDEAQPAPAGPTLAARWQAAAQPSPGARPKAPFPAPDTSALGVALAAARTAQDQALLQFVLETGQPPEVLARLRWQHLDLATRRLRVPSLTGAPLREVPLSAAALEAIVTPGVRKYGLVFKREARAIQALLRRCAQAAGLDETAFQRAAALRLMQDHALGAAEVAACLGLHDLETLPPTKNAPGPSPTRA